MREESTTPSQDRFVESMQQTGAWLASWVAGELSDEVLADRVAGLLRDRDGARGFFVVTMTSEIPLLDRQPEALLQALRQAGEAVVDLTVRNLVMSSAMAVHHARNHDRDQCEGSQKVQRRGWELLAQLRPELVLRRLEPMLAATRLKAEHDDPELSPGLPEAVVEDLAMLRRWQYDHDQLTAIAAALERVADPD